MRFSILLSWAIFALTACETALVDSSVLPRIGGYRGPEDLCQRIGESPQTNQYLDDSAALVGCPSGYEGLGIFQSQTNATLVGMLEGYILFSVPNAHSGI